MARIRTIKPETPQSESLGSVSRDARLCFILLWTVSDDEGRLRGNSRMLASLLFPYDDDAKDHMDDWLDELERAESIIRYEIKGHKYIQIVNWLEHQKIDKPSKSKIPPFNELSRTLANVLEHSSGDLRTKDQDQGVDQDSKGQRDVPDCPDGYSGGTNDLETAKDAWNEMASANGLTLVRKLSHQRQVKLKRRISDAGGLQQFCFLVQTIPKARFLVGDNRDGWKADFDFVLQESSFIKLLEGKYHNNGQHSDPIRGAAAILAHEAGLAAETGEFHNPSAWDD